MDHSTSARQEIAGMGLSGKHATDMKNWHENQVVHAMKTNPVLKGQAQTGIIQYVSSLNSLWLCRSFISSHTAHEGGSDPNEKNHITASFYNKQNQIIPNQFNGGVRIILHLHNRIDL